MDILQAIGGLIVSGIVVAIVVTVLTGLGNNPQVHNTPAAYNATQSGIVGVEAVHAGEIVAVIMGIGLAVWGIINKLRG